MAVREISTQGRDATGVRVMNLDDGQIVASVAPILATNGDDVNGDNAIVNGDIVNGGEDIAGPDGGADGEGPGHDNGGTSGGDGEAG
jgi:hypothetical protein